ncbi:TMEM165/GDT1 family protein [Methyloglobulus sp.]|uniref:TMEM165/GDT1 family protein n=1 Tax=Methyloglobulus sp. TaxID=2518622 RepID=UPI0032B83B60
MRTAILIGGSLKSTDTPYEFLHKLTLFFSSFPFDEVQAILTAVATSFALILAAEMGDKSQLVCMALASKHRPVPVVLGALSAFAVLNALAVGFGKAIANWLPEYVIAAAVALLFIIFGIQALRTQLEDPHEEVKEKSGHGIFFATFLLITVAEFGDKTQLAVVALSSTSSPIGVWLGSTIALGTTSALGVLAGKKLLEKISLELLHKIGGTLFLMLSGVAVVKAYQSYFGS